MSWIGLSQVVRGPRGTGYGRRGANPESKRKSRSYPLVEVFLDDLGAGFVAVVVPARPEARAAHRLAELGLFQDIREPIMCHHPAAPAAREQPIALSVTPTGVIRLGELQVGIGHDLVDRLVS